MWVGLLAQKDKKGAIGMLLYNLSESAFKTKILSLLFCSLKDQDQNIEKPPLSKINQEANTFP